MIEDFDRRVRATGIEAELQGVRNLKPLWGRFGTLGGAALGASTCGARRC